MYRKALNICSVKNHYCSSAVCTREVLSILLIVFFLLTFQLYVIAFICIHRIFDDRQSLLVSSNDLLFNDFQTWDKRKNGIILTNIPNFIYAFEAND